MLLNSTRAINSKEKYQLSNELTAGRYMNSSGKAINLAQTKGAVRLELTLTEPTVESITDQALSQEEKPTKLNPNGKRPFYHLDAKGPYYLSDISVGNPP